MPRVFIIDDPAPNAFATGRKPDTAAVCATTGLLDIMSDTELEGVFAHEMGHVKNYDIRVSMVAFCYGCGSGPVGRRDVTNGYLWFRRPPKQHEGQAGQLMFLIGIIAAILAR